MSTQESLAANRAAGYDELVDYEQHLHHLYGRLKVLYGGHSQHQTSPPTIGPEPAGGGPSVRIAPGRTCTVDDRCDDLNESTIKLIADEFPPEAIEALLVGPRPVLLDIHFDAGTHTVRDACVAAFVHDAEANRIFPHGATSPVDPATTKPRFVWAGPMPGVLQN